MTVFFHLAKDAALKSEISDAFASNNRDRMNAAVALAIATLGKSAAELADVVQLLQTKLA